MTKHNEDFLLIARAIYWSGAAAGAESIQSDNPSEYVESKFDEMLEKLDEITKKAENTP